jgi:hypothetical protein
MLGWRLWRLHGGVLRSWALTHDWTPGPNHSLCRSAKGPRCVTSPGPDCHCGFWGLYSPLDCLTRGRHEGAGWWPVMGLMRGWGSVAVHGQEGFRAEHAAVVCLFSDWPLVPGQVRPGDSQSSLWRRALGLFGGDDGPSPFQRAEREDAVKAAAGAYGVPLLSIAGSLRLGVLEELGVDRRGLSELEPWRADGP